jgi:hypothetical protein
MSADSFKSHIPVFKIFSLIPYFQQRGHLFIPLALTGSGKKDKISFNETKNEEPSENHIFPLSIKITCIHKTVTYSFTSCSARFDELIGFDKAIKRQ